LERAEHHSEHEEEDRRGDHDLDDREALLVVIPAGSFCTSVNMTPNAHADREVLTTVVASIGRRIQTVNVCSPMAQFFEPFEATVALYVPELPVKEYGELGSARGSGRPPSRRRCWRKFRSSSGQRESSDILPLF